MRGHVVLQPKDLLQLMNAIDDDATFLKHEGTTDYSLLLGIAEPAAAHVELEASGCKKHDQSEVRSFGRRITAN